MPWDYKKDCHREYDVAVTSDYWRAWPRKGVFIDSSEAQWLFSFGAQSRTGALTQTEVDLAGVFRMLSRSYLS